MSDLATALRGLEQGELIDALDTLLERTDWDSTDPEVQAVSREELDKMAETMTRDYPALANIVIYIAGKFAEAGADERSVKLLRTGATMLGLVLKERAEQDIFPPDLQ